MPKKQFDRQAVLDVAWEEVDSDVFELVEMGKWVSEGKYEYQNVILKEKATGKYYRFSHSRSGSYHTDYTYDWEYGGRGDTFELTEVEPVEKTVIYWKEV